LEFSAMLLNTYAGAVAENAKKQLRDGELDVNNRLEKMLIVCLDFIKTISASTLYPAFQGSHVLDHVAAMNLEKLQQRQLANTLKGSGDDR
jgi:hypothetical protein